MLAEILGTVGGFGSSMLFVPIAGLFMDFHSVLGITALFHVASNITKIAFFRKGFDKKLVLSMGIPAVLLVIVGAYFSSLFRSDVLEFLLAIFLILLSAALLLFPQLKLKATQGNAIGSGMLSGIIAGMLGTGGAIRGIALTVFHLKTEVFIATSAMIDLGVDLSRSVVYVLEGYVHRKEMLLIPMLLVASVVGTYTGKRILEKLSEEQFRKIVLVLVLFTGLFTLGRWVAVNV
ncbi:MAG: sulfite exporter TauE/SafE family protein [Flavobacteriales bacterium]|nr:sulfite exporter TauE/SafE family protein [Flavobacteriales bacterium]